MKRQRPALNQVSGCYKCERRRILCDRALPSCLKCTKKGLVCPGYGQRLRWAGGAAIRGRLAQAEETIADDAGSLSTTAGNEIWASASSFHSISKKTLHKLIDHWDKQIAPLMVWVDSDENPYRRYVTPMAYRHPVVGLAMAAVSSQHASISLEDDSFSEKARNEAIGMISAYVKNITTHVMSGRELGNQLDERAVEWVLAAMLLLSCYEMADSGSAAADFHRRAARSLVNTFETTGRGESLLLNFLRNQLSVHDIFACTTSFDLSSMQQVILPRTADDSILFSTYLRYLHDVTLLSRQFEPSTARLARLGLTFSHLRTQFEVARGETLMTAGRLALQPASRRRNFICVVNIHYYAALLYSARCLEIRIEEQRKELIDGLFDQIAAMGAIDEWLHCLPWSLFIAGVESHEDDARQGIISDLYSRICRIMRFKNFWDVAQFLQVFWAADERDWRDLARKWELSGQPVLLP
ncbi:hypothetical protein NCS57_01084700 [Fusarium keratoplasticum]|uniref:Uncharacterized protein n=1 Tax=Fusarium keratoplasticum TaxID=1328300 RepID=A0ACC0QSK9_9HYPO|nr:hypothetical protein NCS57_01084700 [Fusarium keratoplasticum]KAI8661054.1 hypothetical protein NCS57_01084700 [Fusarium keratoplasticum]KAI8662064.1 hypothetical protein NCS55_01078900 [Fusarium keratoplasticum]